MSAVFGPGVLPTDGRVQGMVFDADGRYLVADGRTLYVPGDPAGIPLGIEGHAVAHPKLPLVAVYNTGAHPGSLHLVNLEGGPAVVQVSLDAVPTNDGAVASPASVAFDPSGAGLVVSFYHRAELHRFGLDGAHLGTLPLPSPDDTAAILCFASGSPGRTPGATAETQGQRLLAFNGTQTLLQVPLDGAPPVAYPLATKTTSYYAAPVAPDRVYAWGTNGAILVNAVGQVLWKHKLECEGASAVPGRSAVALVRQNKHQVLFLDLATGATLATLKAKVEVSPIGFACTAAVVAWSRRGAIELALLPALPPA